MAALLLLQQLDCAALLGSTEVMVPSNNRGCGSSGDTPASVGAATTTHKPEQQQQQHSNTLPALGMVAQVCIGQSGQCCCTQ